MAKESGKRSRREFRYLAGLLDKVREPRITWSLDSVSWDSLAFKAGVTPDMQLQAVNDQKYTPAGLRETILEAEKTKDPIKLLLKRGDEFVTISLDYRSEEH